MMEYDEGPKRRVSQRRKSIHSVQGKADNSRSGSTQWITNSFTSSSVHIQPVPGKAVSSPHKSVHVSSTPKTKRRRTDVKASRMSLNDSDALLADLDIDAIASQSQSATDTNNRICKDKENIDSINNSTLPSKQIGQNTTGSQNIKTYKDLSKVSLRKTQTNNRTKTGISLNNSCVNNDESLSVQTGHSQYFTRRFGNYKPTQAETEENQNTTLDIGYNNSVTASAKSCNDTSFSFSFIGEDTICEDAGNSQGNSQTLAKGCSMCHGDTKIHSSQCRTSSHCEPDKQNSNTQRCINATKKFRCTPYLRTDSLSGSVLQSDENANVIDISADISARIDSQMLSQTQISVVNTTLLKDDEGFRYRCTPFKKTTKDLPSQIPTQAELLAGTQYNSYLHESCVDSQLSCSGNKSPDSTGTHKVNRLTSTQFTDTQIQSTGLVNMTGAFVETQEDNRANVAADTSSDMFDDTFHNGKLDTSTTQVNEDKIDTFNTQTNEDITSNTQCLGGCDTQKVNKQQQHGTHSDDSEKRQNIMTGNSLQCKSTSNVVGIRQTDSDLVLKEAMSFTKPARLPVPAPEHSTVPRTPGHAAGSLQDKIKQKLMENTGRHTPQGPGSLVDQLREQVLERVHMEAQINKDKPDSDIGPFYGLPTKVKHLFENYRGIKTLYEWQDECLRLPALVNRENLIYSLPTSGGKTLVAEIVILQEILCHKKDALLILPFVSIVQEKVRNISQFAVDLNFHVEEYAGSKGRFPPIKRRSNKTLFIATIEKAQSIVNSLIETDRIDNLGLVVVDELHMLGEGGKRGSTLESTLMKVMHAAAWAQIIGMSATLNNTADIKQFLHATIYSNNFRPVTLTEYVKVTDNVYRVQTDAKCPDDQFTHDRIVCFQYLPEMTRKDPEHLLGLALEVIPDNSCLVFCATKKHCENVAQTLSSLMSKYKRELTSVKRAERKALLKELYTDADGKMCPVLQYTIHFGVAYHHSGLTVDERKLIEEAYSAGTLCLLACTSTLAAGVNLPAKRVILRSPYVGQCFLSRSQYKQMVGRAGRAGIDSSGESILICKQSDKDKVVQLLSSPIEHCHSSLVYDGGKGVRSLLLSTIGLKIVTCTDDVFKFVSRSLAHCQRQALGVDIMALCRDSLQALIDCGLVLQTNTQSEDPKQAGSVHSLQVTPLGKATYKGPVDPDYARMLYTDLKKAEESIVLSTHLHLLYLVTPYDLIKDMTPAWAIYFRQMSNLTASEMKVANLIGVPESYVARKASQQKSRMKVDEFVVSRFYLTLMLYELWQEKTVWEVAEKFQLPRGFIQNLLSSAASFASCVTHFCLELEEFWAYQDLLGNFVKRLSYCVTAELIPLMEISGVKLGRARLMHAAGYKTLSSVASARPEDLVKSVQYMPHNVARQIVASAKLLLNEKKDAMLEEVEALVTIPAALAGGVTLATIPTPGPVTPTMYPVTPAMYPVTPAFDSQSSITDKT